MRFYSVSGARQLGSRSRRSTAARGSPATAGKGTEPRDGPARCLRSPQARRDPVPVLLPEVPSPSARSTTGSAGSQSLHHYRKWCCPLQARPHAAANTQHPLRPGRNYSSQQLSGGRCVVTSRVSASGRGAPRRAVPCRAGLPPLTQPAERGQCRPLRAAPRRPREAFSRGAAPRTEETAVTPTPTPPRGTGPAAAPSPAALRRSSSHTPRPISARGAGGVVLLPPPQLGSAGTPRLTSRLRRRPLAAPLSPPPGGDSSRGPALTATFPPPSPQPSPPPPPRVSPSGAARARAPSRLGCRLRPARQRACAVERRRGRQDLTARARRQEEGGGRKGAGSARR